MKLVTKHQVSAINNCWEKREEKCAYMFNVHKKQLSRQTGSRNRTDQKTLPTIWYTNMTLVTKYQISAINSYWEKCDDKYLGRTEGRKDGRKDGRTDKRTEVKQYIPLPLWGAGVFLDMCCIVCFTMHSYIVASRFRLCRDSYFQATNHQWAYLLKLDRRQYILIDWALTFKGISFSVMWGSIFSIYQSPVSLFFKIGYTPRDCVRLVNILNCVA